MGDTDQDSMLKCSQCGKPAVVSLTGLGLCVDHYLKMQQANYLQSTMLAAQINFLQGEIEAGEGYLVRHPRAEIPPPPFIGDNLTLNNINVSNSNIGAINTGTIQNLDASITLMQNQGKSELAKAVNELAQAILDSEEVSKTAKNEIAEQLEFLVAQATAEPRDRSIGVAKSILSGLRSAISVVANLATIWDRVEPLFKVAFGI